MSQNRSVAWEPTTRVSLLARIQDASDVEAWRLFVDLYTPLVYRYCRRQRLQDADARDVTQNVLVNVSRAIVDFAYDSDRGRFRAWLGTITRHEIARFMRTSKRKNRVLSFFSQQLQNEGKHANADSDWQHEFNSYVLQRALERIRGDFAVDVWQAFELTWLNNCKPAEAARRMQKKQTWVYKAKFQVLQRLRAEVEYLSADIVGLFSG